MESAVIVDGTTVWAEGTLDWRPLREVKSQLGDLGEAKATSVAATFFYELGARTVGAYGCHRSSRRVSRRQPRARSCSCAGRRWDKGSQKPTFCELNSSARNSSVARAFHPPRIANGHITMCIALLGLWKYCKQSLSTSSNACHSPHRPLIPSIPVPS
eukprot:COSAG02_NODE_2285_length_9220_cov_87.964368_2_plen_158_part_00